MEMVKTSSFELAVYKKGDADAEKLALCLPGRLDTQFLLRKGIYILQAIMVLPQHH